MASADATSLGRKMLTGTGWIMVWRMASRTLGFANTLVLARLLVPADFGLVAMATAFAGVFDSLSQFPVQDALIRRIEDDTRLHNSAFTIQVGRALMTAAILALAAPLAARWFAEPRLTPVILVLAAFTAVSGIENIGIVEFQRQMQFNMHVQALLVPRILQVLATVSAAWATHSYWALLVGIGVQRVSRVAVTYYIHPYRPRLSLAGLQELVGFSFWLWAAGMASLVWDQCDTFVVGRFFGSANLGLYTIGIQVAILPIVEVVAPAASVLIAGFSLSQRTGGTATKNALPLAGALLLGVIPTSLALSAGAADIVRLLLGSKWSAAAPLVEIAAGMCLFSPVSYICMAVLVTIGQVRRQFYAVASAAALRVVVIYLAARFLDLEMVVAGSVACSAAEALFFLWQLRTAGYAGLRRNASGLLRAAVSGLVTIAVLARYGGAWTHAGPGVFVAGSRTLGSLAHLTLLGTIAALTFGGCVVALWFASGRPEGPERIVARLFMDLMPAKLRRAG